MSGKENQIRIGIDIGGTFTDLMVINLLKMEMYETKVPSIPQNLLSIKEDGLRQGLKIIDDVLDFVDTLTKN